MMEYATRSQSRSKLSEYQISHLAGASSFSVFVCAVFYRSLLLSFRFTGVPNDFQRGAGSNFFKIPFLTGLAPSLTNALRVCLLIFRMVSLADSAPVCQRD